MVLCLWSGTNPSDHPAFGSGISPQAAQRPSWASLAAAKVVRVYPASFNRLFRSYAFFLSECGMFL
jgi:hypothetical protein